MDPLLAAAALAGLVAVSTVAGLLWRARDGRVRMASASASVYRPSDFDGTVSFADQATLVQFSTEFCSRCPSTERMLRAVADGHSGVGVAVVDLTSRQDLATRFRITQTPTVLVLDRDGRERARSGGAPERAAIETVLTTLARSSYVVH
ncbi:MAG: thioredoxin family protein [Mycetocola sp.]